MRFISVCVRITSPCGLRDLPGQDLTPVPVTFLPDLPVVPLPYQRTNVSSSQGSGSALLRRFSGRKRAGSLRLKSFIFCDLNRGKSATKLSLFCELIVCVKLSMAETLDGYGLQIRPHPRCRINSDGSSGGGPHSLAVKIKCVGAIDDSGNRWQPICRPFSLHRLLINLLLFKKSLGESVATVANHGHWLVGHGPSAAPTFLSLPVSEQSGCGRATPLL